MLHVLYFVHDLADPAVRRRVLTLQAGGAKVTLAGFRRDENALAAISGVTPIELGRTQDARFIQRVGAVAKSALALRSALRHVGKPDVIIARNLEMLALANRAVSIFGGNLPIAYECLDIHRLLLHDGLAGKTIRGVERYLGAKAGLLLTSSPAFVDNYFDRRSGLDLQTLLLENKVIELEENTDVKIGVPRPPGAGQPWRIGWFGALRCSRSLSLLADFSRRMDGRFEVVLRGRPANTAFGDFDGFVASEPFIRFHGAYKNPEDLQSIYSEVQFSWAIDFFEQDQNSSWLLPNRLYEGCLHGTVPIAMARTETSRFLADRKIGFTLEKASPEAIEDLLGDMDEQVYAAAFAAVAEHDRRNWVIDRVECQALVERLASMTRPARPVNHRQTLVQPHHNEGGLL
jgi:succinoglycan biosynthesis protein ExoL